MCLLKGCCSVRTHLTHPCQASPLLHIRNDSLLLFKTKEGFDKSMRIIYSDLHCNVADCLIPNPAFCTVALGHSSLYITSSWASINESCKVLPHITGMSKHTACYHIKSLMLLLKTLKPSRSYPWNFAAKNPVTSLYTYI